MSDLHVVLGAGQIGPLVAQQLLAQGARVRQVRRGAGPGVPGAELVSGDLSDPSFAERALAGAAVVYHCVNAPYHQWVALLPPLQRAIVYGAAKAGAKLVVLDNLYLYGRPSGPMTEDSPVAPCSRKGELRARLSLELFEAHARGDVRVAVGRASDFYGPGVTLAAVFGERFYQRLFRGQAGEVLGDPDAPHTYSYAPDVAAGLVALGARDEALGRSWHLPAAPARPTRETMEKLMAAAGMRPQVTTLPLWVLRVGGLFSPLLREVPEMAYQWRVPFVLDDARFRAAFGLSATPAGEAIAATAGWAKRTYGAGR